MKNFKIFLVETLIQLTILVSISRYHPHQSQQYHDLDPYQELLQKSLLDFERHNYIQQSHFFKQQFQEQPYQQYYNNFPLTSKDLLNFGLNSNTNNKEDSYLEDLIKHSTREQRQQIQIYLNPHNYLRVTDKFLEYPELQTKHSLVSFCNNANISPEDMSAIKRILFEQDIDVGVDKSWYEPEYKTSSYEKNYTAKDDLDLLFQNKPTFVFKSPKVALDEELLLIPEGYQKVVEEDTGEIFFIPTEQPVKNEVPVVEPIIIEPKLLMTDTTEFNTFNPVTLERYSSNKGTFDELNDYPFDEDLSFLNTPPPDVKFDEAWLKNFMEPTAAAATPQMPTIQTQNSVTDFLSSLDIDGLEDKKEDFTLFIPQEQQQQATTETNFLNPEAISVVNNDELSYLNSVNNIIDDILSSSSSNNNNVSQFEYLINNSDLYNLGEIDDFELSTANFTNNHAALHLDHNSLSSSSILSDNDSSNSASMYNTQADNHIVVFKQEPSSHEALFGFQHNHTYLQGKTDDVYHPHSYKNKMKSLLNATNRESKDEALLLEYKIDYSLDDVVNTNVEVFTEMLKDPNLNPEQLNIMKDIRRRGKNKIAAKTCRKRKIDSIDNLKEDVDELREKKRMLETEREKIQNEMKQFASKIDSIYKDLTGSDRDPSDPIKNYIENLLKQLNEKTGDAKTNSKTPRNNKRK